MHLLDGPGKPSTALVRLGGLGSILGGALWIVLLLIVQLQMFGIVQYFVVPEAPCCDVGLRYALDYPILAVPMLLFMLGLAGLSMYTRQQRALGKMGLVGIVVALVGIIVGIAHVFFGEYWRWWFGGWWYGGYGRLGDPYSLPPDGLLWVLWYASFGPGLAMLAIGLVIFVHSISRAGVLAIRWTNFLTMTSLVMSPLPLVINALLYFGRRMTEVVVYSSSAFMTIFVLFGVAWVWMGIALWQAPVEDYQSGRTQATPPPRTAR
jgi:hypothetical protein